VPPCCSWLWAGSWASLGGWVLIFSRVFKLLGTSHRVKALLVVVLTLSASVVVSSAHSGAVSGRRAAARAALAALGAARHSGAEIVFGLAKPVSAGTVIAEAGPSSPGSGGSAARSPRRVIARLTRPAWFFYEDLAPFQQYQHPGRVALVDAHTGRVSVSRVLSWPPVLDGRRPAFMQSISAYDGTRYRVFYRPYTGSGTLVARDLARVSSSAMHAALDSTLAQQVAPLLASQHACTIRATDTLRGGFYGFANLSQSRAALYYRFSQLGQLAPGFRSFSYSSAGRTSPMSFVGDQIKASGCRDVAVYLAGAGYADATAVNLGMGVGGRKVVHQDLTLSDLRRLANANPAVTFEFVIDAAHASGFQTLVGLANVLLVATPSAPGGGSFTYLPEARIGGKLVANGTNPLRLLQLTDRLAFGLDNAIGDACEVSQLQSLTKSGKLRSALAYLLARGFSRGGAVDFAANSGVGSPPRVQTHGFTAGTPSCAPVTPVVTARADSYAAASNAPLSVAAANGVLANDTDSGHFPLSVDRLNGAGGSAPFVGTTAKGAAVTMQANGSFTYDPTASSALQALKHGQTATDTFTYRANDGHGGTATATVTITVAGPNHPPVANPDTYGATNAAALTENAAGGLLANDTDPDGDTLAVDQLNGAGGTPPFMATTGKGATVTLNADGSFTYDPTGSSTLQALPRGQTATDTFTYRANDGHGGTASATVTITVTGVINHPPVANPDGPYPATNNATVNVSAAAGVLANDSDPDGDALTIDQVGGVNGTAPLTATSSKGATVVMQSDGSFSYDPTSSMSLQALPRGQSTTDTFTYEINDGHGGTATATVTITVTGVINHPPVANPDSYSVDNNVALNQAAPGVLANDTDPDGDTLTVDQLNGTGGTAPFTATTGKGATVTLKADGSFTYDPTGSATLQALQRGTTTTDTFTYRVNDGHGGTATATVTITVTGAVDHPPVANPDSYTADNNAVLSPNAGSGVLANDTDPDGDTLVVDQLNGAGGTAPFTATTGMGATVTLRADGSFSYDPTGSTALQAIARGHTATDTFRYRANDGHGGTATATVTITVVGVINHPPVANPDSYAVDNNAQLNQDAAAGVLANDTDLDGDSLTVDQLNGVGGTPPFTGTSAMGAAVTISSDGSFGYDPTGSSTLQAIPRGQTATDTFTYEVNDGHGGTAIGTVTITVTGAVNHPPVANPDSYAATNNAVLSPNATSGVLANDTDPDGDQLTVDQLNGTGGTAPFTATTIQGAAVTMNGDGSFSYDPTGSAALQALPRGQSVTDSFTYRANDGHGGTATATVTITVTGALNHPPVANPDSYAANNNAVLSPTAASGVLANDTDPDGDTLVVDQLNGAGGTAPFTATTNKGATVTLRADGSFTYDPTGSTALQAIPRGQTATDSFTYRANDGHGGTATAMVTITVVGVINHPPVANPDSYAVDNNAVLTVSPRSSGVLANDTDLDGDSLSVDQLNPPTGPSGTAPFVGTSAKGAAVSLNADGTFSYDPTNAAQLHPPNLTIGQSTTDTFTYDVNDGHGGTAIGTVTVTVTAVDTPPTANDFTVGTNVVGNTLIEVGTQPSPSSEPKTTDPTNLAAHSSDPDIPFGDSLTFSAPATSSHGGNVSVTNPSTGAFTYRPPPGFTGTDTFTYTATDSFGKSDTGQVTLHVSNMVWYVQNNAGGAHDGRSGSPFNTLASAESASGSAAGDFIYVFKGDGTTSGQDAGITLKANQTLLSEKYGLVVGGQTLTAGNPANRPLIGNSAGDGVTLASGDTVKGFDITGTGSGRFAIAGGAGDASGTIADDILHGASSAGGLTLNGTSGTWAISDLNATGTGGAAFDATAAGTVNFTGTNSLTGTGAGAFKNAGATTYSGTIGTTSSTGGAANGIDVSGASGSLTFNGGTLSGTTTNGFLASGGNANVTYSGTETNSAGHSVNINGRSGGTVDVESTINDTGTGVTIANNTAGTTTINSATKTINTGANTAVSISGNTSQTVNLTGGGLNVDTTSGDGLSISGGGTVTISGGSDTIDTNGSGTALHISGASAGNISSDAAINSSVTNTGHSVDISGHTGGTISQSGSVKERGTGLTMTSNSGATINFSGTIDASTGANTAFNATGGGTVSVTGASNTLTTTTGTALNVQTTNIGSSGLTFRSISAGTTTGSSGDGIVLDTTGSSGGLTVTGNSTGACGGSVSGTTPSLSVTAANSADCTGGVIQHKTGSDGSTTSGIGIYLNNTAKVSLTRMWLHDFDNFGIFGSGVSGLTISNSLFNGSNGTNQNGSGEGAVYFFGLSGSTSVTNSSFSGGALDTFHLENNGSQVLNRITFTGDNFGDTLNATSASALFMQADCTAQLNMTVGTSVFTAARANNVNVSVRGQSTDDLVVSNSQFSNSDPNQVSGATNLSVAAGGPSSGCADNTLNPTLTYNIHNNTFRDALGTALSISKGGVGTGTFGTTANPGIIDSNTFGVSSNSASSGAGGIGSILVGGGSITNNITNNTIHGAINGINVGANSSFAGGGQGYYRAVIQGNTVDTPNVGAGNITNGLLAQFGAVPANPPVTADDPKACLTLGGSTAALKNNLDGGRNGGADLRLRVRFGTLIGVLGYTGANNDNTAMANFLNSQNVFGTAGAIVTNNATTGSGWTGTCPT
jgi:VCBS repeat-containing protein